MKKIFSMLMVLMLLATLIPAGMLSAQAASWPSISTSKPIKAYTISTGNNTKAYADKNFTSRAGTIYGTDELYISKIGTNSYGQTYIQGTYPVSSGRKNFYAPLSIVTTANKFTGNYEISRAQLTAYRRAGSSASAGTVWSGDRVYRLAENGNYTQILFNLGSASNITGWRMGWISTSNYNKHIAKQTSAPVSSGGLTSPVPNGVYFNKQTSDNGWYGYHDINVNVSTSTPVYAIADGTVTYYQKYITSGGKQYLVSYGNYISFTSKDNAYTAKYCHLSSFKGATQKVPSSQTKQWGTKDCKNYGYSIKEHNLGTRSVKKGEIIGYIGTTGNSSGLHLHFELYKNGSRQNPVAIFPALKK